jgi:hypothetical protein
MKNFIKIWVVGVLVLSVCVYGFITLASGMAYTEIKKEKAEYEVNVGKRMILEKDTLTIIDFSTLDETYTLSNGIKVSKGIINNAKFVD